MGSRESDGLRQGPQTALLEAWDWGCLLVVGKIQVGLLSVQRLPAIRAKEGS